jgi:hypothetical protein
MVNRYVLVVVHGFGRMFVVVVVGTKLVHVLLEILDLVIVHILLLTE